MKSEKRIVARGWLMESDQAGDHVPGLCRLNVNSS